MSPDLLLVIVLAVAILLVAILNELTLRDGGRDRLRQRDAGKPRIVPPTGRDETAIYPEHDQTGGERT